MTTEQLIEKMRSELYDTHFCKQDFEKYDVARIIECCEPFLWEVYENGTYLAMIGPTTILEWLATESLRMQIFRNFYAPINIISCQQPSKDSKLFYFDGLSFMRIEHDKVHELYDNLWVNTIRKEFDKHPEEAKQLAEAYSQDASLDNEMYPEIVQDDMQVAHYAVNDVDCK